MDVEPIARAVKRPLGRVSLFAVESAGDPETEALDRLLAAPFDQFVALRREIALELRKKGDAPAARAVTAMAKPSRTAWALDQVARRRPELLSAALDAWATAAAAPQQSDADGVRATARAFRDRVADVVAAAGEAASEDGAPLNLQQSRRVAATLQAIAGGEDGAARERLVRGRLVADVDVDDPFAGLGEAPEGRPRPARARERELAEERERRARAQALEASRARVAALEAEARDARTAAREAEVAATRAQADANRARRAVEAVERKLEDARKELRGLAR